MDPSVPTSPDATSLSLLQRLRGRDDDAWRRFVHLYGPLVYSWCRRLGVVGDDAADVVQEVWTAVATSLERFDRHEGGSFRGWLWQITRHKLVDRCRRRTETAEAAGGSTIQQMIQQIPTPEPVDESGTETHQLLQRALELIRAEFEPHTWSAFWRTTVDGVSAADAGEEVGLAANAVYQAKFRVLRRLRQEMAGLMEV